MGDLRKTFDRLIADECEEMHISQIHLLRSAILHRITAPESDGGLGMKIMAEPSCEIDALVWELALPYPGAPG